MLWLLSRRQRVTSSNQATMGDTHDGPISKVFTSLLKRESPFEYDQINETLTESAI